MQVAGQQGSSLLDLLATGARVSNAYPTFPIVGDSPAKVGLIPYVLSGWHLMESKGLPLWDGDASD